MDQFRRRQQDNAQVNLDHVDEIADGAIVYGSDGQKFGEVAATYRQYLIVERGFFFPQDYFVPIEEIASAEADRVYLRLPTDFALRQGWDTPPAEAAEALRPSRTGKGGAISASEHAPVAPDGPTANFAIYPDTYAVGTNTGSYEAIVPPDVSGSHDDPSR